MNRGRSMKNYCIEQMVHQSVISKVRIIKMFVFSINKNLAIMENDLKKKQGKMRSIHRKNFMFYFIGRMSCRGNTGKNEKEMTEKY